MRAWPRPLLIALVVAAAVTAFGARNAAAAYAYDTPSNGATTTAADGWAVPGVAPLPDGSDLADPSSPAAHSFAWTEPSPPLPTLVVGAEDVSAASTGARDAPVESTQPGERFVRVGNGPQNLRWTFETPGGTTPGTYAFPESTFEEIGLDPAALKSFGDLPGEPPSVYRILEPPGGTPIQRGTVPGGEFGGEGGVPEVFFPEGF